VWQNQGKKTLLKKCGKTKAKKHFFKQGKLVGCSIENNVKYLLITLFCPQVLSTSGAKVGENL
jgi:hypothetical protein